MTKNSNLKILWITPKWTLPIEDGARVATKAILSPLLIINPSIDYLALAGRDEKIINEELREIFPVNNIFVIKRDPHLIGLKKKIEFLKTFLINPFFPVSFSRYNTANIKTELEKILKQNTYDLIFLDGLHCAVPFLQIHKHPKLVLRAHNVEKDLWLTGAKKTRNIFLKCFFYYQASLVNILEKRILEYVDQTFAISPEDQLQLSKLGQKKVFQLPVGQNFNSPLPEYKSDKIELLFLGKLDWAPNQNGLKWFLREVWPKLSKNRYHLTIAGSGDPLWLIPYLDQISFLGRVPDVKPIYAKAHIILVPIFYGSGTRIKVLEASCFKRVCLSTTAGVEGSPVAGLHEAYLAGENANEWISILENISHKQINTKAQEAFNLCSKFLDENQIAQNFLKDLLI